jgi:hypothetical protein
MAWGRRCEIGCESWPDDDRYKICPLCKDPAPRYKNLTPMDASAARHREFEVFYREHCERLGIPVDGPLRDDLPAHGTAVVATDSALVPSRSS